MEIGRFVIGISTIAFLIINYIFVPNIFKGDAVSAVYLLNTIATSLSTIFALSLSLIMVAIQLSAGKYSSRIFDFFLRFSLNVPLIIIFVTAILHSSYTMAQIKVAKDNLAVQQLSKAISFDVVLLGYGFIILLVYIFNVIQILKPEKLVERIKGEIYSKLHKEHFREALYLIERLGDVAKKTTLEMDSVTAVSCVRVIAGTVYNTEITEPERRHWYMEQIIANLNGVASVAFNQKEHGIAEVIVDELTNIANFSIQKGDFSTAEYIVETFSVIVSASLLGQKQLMTVQKITERMEDIALQVINIAANTQAAGLITKVFKTINFLGKQIMDTEPLGVTFVAKYMVTGGLGAVLATIGEKRCDKVVPEIFYEYVDLIVRVMRKGETKNIITITTWMRKHLLEEDVDSGKVFLLLKVYLVMAGVAIYLKRYDKSSLIIKALGKYYPTDEALLRELQEEQLVVRHFFDYHRPEKYLQEAYYIWDIFHHACKNYAEEVNTQISLDDIYQNMNNWESLFDGLPVEEIFTSDDLPQNIDQEIITVEDIDKDTPEAEG